MSFLARLQLLTCLMLYVSCVQAIMVKFGTKDGPIEPLLPPTQAPAAPRFNRSPAPVWEERIRDTADPNAQWRPQLFVPQPRYTQIVFNAQPSSQEPINNAQSFVNSYIPKHEPVQAKPVTNYFTPAQFLSSQSIPGFGIRYFVPAYINDLQQKKEQQKQEDADVNSIETNEVDRADRDSADELQWKYEKDITKRISRHTLQSAPYPYEWPAFVARQ